MTALVFFLLTLGAAGAATARADGQPAAGWLDGLLTEARLRGLLDREDVRALRNKDFVAPSGAQVDLGRMLFFDKILSGNRDISCATCHHPLAATGDGISLSVGVGGAGLATTRVMGEHRERVPRNAPELWNRGHASFISMFWDSRIVEDASQPSGFVNPAGRELPSGLANALSAQAMFPVTSEAEMRGDPGENEIADASTNTEIWQRLMERLLAIAEYRDLFMAAYPGVGEDALGFEHAANAIAAYEGVAFRADGSPFDGYLRGDSAAMSLSAKRGALLFYGDAGCGDCHEGALQTDFEHYAIAAPQIGPGKGDGPDGDEDLGRGRETGEPDDAYAFRTPSLRNVVQNAPYTHAGAYRDLTAAVRHHLNPRRGLRRYDPAEALLAPNPNPETPFSVMESRAKRGRIEDANALGRTRLSRNELDDLMAFLSALTDPSTIDVRDEAPTAVPSGLPVFD